MLAPSTIAWARVWSSVSAAALRASHISLLPSKAGAVSQNSSLLLLSWPSVRGTSEVQDGLSFFKGWLRPTVTNNNNQIRNIEAIGSLSELRRALFWPWSWQPLQNFSLTSRSTSKFTRANTNARIPRCTHTTPHFYPKDVNYVLEIYTMAIRPQKVRKNPFLWGTFLIDIELQSTHIMPKWRHDPLGRDVTSWLTDVLYSLSIFYFLRFPSKSHFLFFWL